MHDRAKQSFICRISDKWSRISEPMPDNKKGRIFGEAIIDIYITLSFGLVVFFSFFKIFNIWVIAWCGKKIYDLLRKLGYKGERKKNGEKGDFLLYLGGGDIILGKKVWGKTFFFKLYIPLALQNRKVIQQNAFIREQTCTIP